MVRLAIFLLFLSLFLGVVAFLKDTATEAEEGVVEASYPVVVRVPVEDGTFQPAESTRQTSQRATGGNDRYSVAQRIRDAVLAARVKKALAREQSLRGFSFEPVVVQGGVTLRGTVRTPAQRARAAQVVLRVEGVSSLQNNVDAVDAQAEPVPALARQEPLPPEPLPGAAQAEPVRSAENAASNQPETGAAYHTVKSGESLWIIARKYDTSIEQVKRLNGLRSNTIRPGQALRVK